MAEVVSKEFTTGYIRRIDASQRMAEFVISDNSEDRHGTVLNMDNFKLDNFKKNPIVLYQHQGYGGPESDPDDVIASAEVFEEGMGQDKKLIGRAYFEPAEVNEKADKIFKKIQQGTLRATSVGFMPIEDENGRIGQFGKDDGTGSRFNTDTFYFYGQELLEFSIVNIPSNPNAVRNGLGEATRSFTDYPRQAVDNAKKALQIKDGDNPEIQECGTRVGWTRANQLANQEPLSEETVGRMASFRRHQQNADGDPTQDCGAIMWLAWGGEAGVSWAEQKMDELQNKVMPSKQKGERAEPGELSEGDFVRWNSSGGQAEGKIDRIQTSGEIDVPNSSFTINASEDDPAALITVYQENSDGLFEASDVQVGHRFSALTKIDALPTPREAPKASSKHVPALEMTPTAPKEREWDSEAAEQRLRRFFSSDGSGDKETIDFSQYQRAFGYVMGGEEGNFSAYKLPHHDVIEGQMLVVYNALVAAAAAINGARGGVDIPEEDMPAVKAHITMHYHQFSERSPFEEEPEQDMGGGDGNEMNKLSYDTWRLLKIRERELELEKLNQSEN